VATIRQDISVRCPPAAVWDAVRDLEAVHQRLVPGYAAAATVSGDTRILTMSNGAVVRELILGLDDERRRFAYSVIETPMPIKSHHATFEVFPDGDDTLLVWTTDALPDSLEPEIRARTARGAAVIKQTLEAACGQAATCAAQQALPA
jgi:carbon monoxide dehydrogenase subunit G